MSNSTITYIISKCQRPLLPPSVSAPPVIHCHPFIHSFGTTKSIRYIEPKSLLVSAPSAETPAQPVLDDHQPPPGTVKSILPCTPLAIVKCLEYVGVYNKILPYGDRAYGKIITVINR